MSYGIVNADQIGTSVQGYSLGAGNSSLLKNKIINGACVIDQRNAGASVTPSANQYLLDRWQAALNVSGKFSVQQSTTAPAGFNYSMLVTSLSAYTIGASELCAIRQNIEGYNIADLGLGGASAKTFTVSFWVRSSLNGTFGGSLMNGAPDYSYPFTYTISAANTWEQKTVTVAGATAGTWLTTNGIGLSILFGLGVGSTFSGTAGSWSANGYYGATGATSLVGTNGATFYITGVQLEVGSSATGFEYVNYQTSLANCQRYYSYFTLAGTMGIGFAQSSTGIQSQRWFYPVTMRASPTVTLPAVSNSSGGMTFLQSNGNYPSSAGGTASTSNVDVYGVTINISQSASNWSAGQAVALYGTGGPSITSSAEL